MAPSQVSSVHCHVDFTEQHTAWLLTSLQMNDEWVGRRGRWGGGRGREGAWAHRQTKPQSVSQSGIRGDTPPPLHLPPSYRLSWFTVARVPQGPRRHGSLGAILEAGCHRLQEIHRWPDVVMCQKEIYISIVGSGDN